jgi:hypothetical protein
MRKTRYGVPLTRSCVAPSSHQVSIADRTALCDTDNLQDSCRHREESFLRLWSMDSLQT